MATRSEVLVVGGGIAGLAAAHRVLELAPSAEVRLVEASDRLGGLVGTERFDGFVVERGPDSLLTEKPWAIALAKRLGLEAELIGTNASPRGAYVVAHGRLERIPDGFTMMAPTQALPLLASPILSWRGKLRAFAEVALPRGAPREDESLASFVGRRFGAEMLDRLAEPMVSGVYGADPALLSLRSTMPRFLELEQKHRSVTLGLVRASRRHAAQAGQGARYGLFASFRRGIGTLAEALAEKLGARAETGTEVRSLERVASGWRARTADGRTFDASVVVIAVPAHRAATLLAPLDAEIARALSSIDFASSATVTFAWERAAVPHPLDAFGFVVPRVERRPVLASTWASVKYAGRAPEGKVLIRVFLGGAGRPDTNALDDAALVGTARRELAELLGVEAEPLFAKVFRYTLAGPQYHVGHAARVDAIDAKMLAHAGLLLAGASYRGVGVPDSIHSGEMAAERAVNALR